MNKKGHGHSLTLVQDHSYSTFSNVFFFKTAMPIQAKFHVEPRWESKVCSNGLGHMINMATMPIYGKTLNIFSGTKRPMTLKVGSSIGFSSTTKFVQVMTMG